MKTIRLFATLRDIAGAKTLDVPMDGVETVRDLVEAIGQVCPPLGAKIIDQNGQLTGLAHIFVDGRNILLVAGLDTPIAPDAQIAIFPPIAGG